MSEPQPETKVSRAAKIKAQALQLGFSKAGIARAENLSPELDRLQEWLARGYQGEMKWMERDPGQRADPRLFWAPARSVIVVALNYYTPHEHAVTTSASGKVSRYAWGDDYHDIVAGRL